MRALKAGVSALVGIAAIVAAQVGTVDAANAEGVVNVYSMRQPFLVEPLFEKFTEETGIEVKTVFSKKGLLERLEQEGENSPADLIMTSSFGNTMRAVEMDLTEAVENETLNERIPAELRGEDGRWFALTTRARILYVSKDRVEPGAISSYEELADPKWKGKICTRSGTHPYNVQLFASMIAHHGRDEAKTWLEGLKANLARKPQGNDRAQVKAVSEGECDIALGNSYYMGKMLAEEDQRAWAKSVNLVFPNADGRGTHVNASGMGLVKGAPNRENAIKLMEFLASTEAQEVYAKVNYEYPVHEDVQPSELVRGWGELKRDSLSLEKIAELRADAVKMVNEVGYNE